MVSAELPHPLEIHRKTEGDTQTGIGITIHWSDGASSQIDSSILRRECPCATCLEARGDSSHAKPLQGRSRLLNVVTSTAVEESNLEQVWPVGNYAIGMRWADGHDTGIYTYQILRQLAEVKSGEE